MAYRLISDSMVSTWIPYPYRYGLGDSDSSDGPSSKAIASGLTSGVLVGASTAQSTGSTVAGIAAGTLEAIAPFTGPAAPFVAAAGLLIGPIVKLMSGCGATCTQATQYANQAETVLQELVRQYFAQPVRYKSSQTAALAAINQVFAALQTSCGNPALGKAGQNCISQRLVASACQWKAAPDSFSGCNYTPFGSAGSGSACWNWVVGYYNPIANDPCVVPDPVTNAATAALSAMASGGFSISSLPGWVVPAGVLLLIWSVL